MKKLLCVLSAMFAIALTVAFAACTKDGTDNNSGKSFVGEWEAVNVTEIFNGESYTSSMPDEMGLTLTASKDGTFTVTNYYNGETVENWITGKWSQIGDKVTLSDIVDSESEADENRYTVTFKDSDTIIFLIEVEVFQEIEEGASYELTRK